MKNEDLRFLIFRLHERARIRRQINTRKSVQDGKTDRIADLLDEAAKALEGAEAKMNLQQCLAVADRIDKEILHPLVDAKRDDKGINLSHLKWMVEQMHGKMSQDKAMRWLGYIQGVLVARYGQDLDYMKQISKEAVGK